MGIINSSISEVVGPEIDKLIDITKSMLSPITNMFKNFFVGFLNLSKDDPAEGIKKDVSKILSIFKKQEKRDQLVKPEKSLWKKIMDVLLGPLFIIGVILGGIASKLMIPFAILSKTVQILSKMKIIGKFLNMFKFFGKMLKPLDKLMDFVRWFSKIGKYFPVLFKKGFLLGFKAFAKFFQPIISLIQFIRGFVSEEGSLVDKIKNGLMFVVRDLIELPARFFGWIADWVMKTLGMKVPEGGTGNLIIDTVMNGFKDFMDWIQNTFESISTYLKENKEPIMAVLTGVWTYVKDLFTLMKDVFMGIIGIIKNSIEFVWALFTGDDWKTPLENIGNIIFETWDKIFTFIKDKIKIGFDLFIEKFIDPLLEKIGFQEKLDAIKNTVKSTVEKFLNIFESIKNYFVNLKDDIVKWFQKSAIGRFLTKDSEIKSDGGMYNPIVGADPINEKNQDIKKIEEERRRRETQIQLERDKKISRQKASSHIVSNSGNVSTNNYNIKGSDEITARILAFNY
jgi:hypothetical protein